MRGKKLCSVGNIIIILKIDSNPYNNIVQVFFTKLICSKLFDTNISHNTYTPTGSSPYYII